MAHRQVLKEGQRSKNEREPAISTSPIKVLHVLMQYFRFSLHTRPLPPLTLAPQVASSPVWTFFSFREMRSQLSWADPCCFLQLTCKKQELIILFLWPKYSCAVGVGKGSPLPHSVCSAYEISFG